MVNTEAEFLPQSSGAIVSSGGIWVILFLILCLSRLTKGTRASTLTAAPLLRFTMASHSGVRRSRHWS